MRTLYSSVDSTYSLLAVSYLDWLSIQESPAFGLVPDQDDSHWLLIQQSPSLAQYSGLVTLVKVGGELYKFDGKVRKELWQSGKLQPPDTLMAQVFDLPEDEFSELNAQRKLSRFKPYPPMK